MASSSRFRSLTRRRDFLELREKGKVMHVNAWMRVDWRRSPNTYVRCGWTVPGYVGSAVLRNRFKRWGREYMRKWARSHSVGLDMNVVLKRKDPEFYRSLRHKEFVRALETMVGKLQRSMGS